MKHIQIQEPDRELKEGIFTLVLKYSVLFIVSYMAGITIFIFKPSRSNSVSNKMDSFMDNPAFFSYIIIVLVFTFYTKRLYDKFKNGLITEFIFDENDNLVQLSLLNTFNGKKRNLNFLINELSVTISTKESILFGKQRVLTFYKTEPTGQKSIITTLNIELTAWVRHPEIHEVLSKLKVYMY
jgi:hypothetical protein